MKAQPAGRIYQRQNWPKAGLLSINYRAADDVVKQNQPRGRGPAMEEVIVSESLPTANEYIGLRTTMGWGRIDEETANQTLQAAAFTVCLRRQDRLVGVARVMGDGAMYFFLADLIVDPEFHGSGYGDRLMHAVTSYFDRSARPSATITLVALNGREAFYEKFGFLRCPSGPFGTGMHYAAAPPPG
jgi:GNAT superfamily N-acetyltransferase